MNRLNKFSKEARRAIAYAREEAKRLRHRLVGTEHLLLGLLKLNDPIIDSLLVSMHTSAPRVAQALDFVVGRSNKAILSEPVFNAGARATLQRAEEIAVSTNAELVGVEHLFLGILVDGEDSVAIGVLESFGIYADRAYQKLDELLQKGCNDLQLVIRYQHLYDATPLLNQVSQDLTMAALMGTLDPVIGREVELERIMQILTRRSKNNPVLLGSAGVGKTAIAEGLALRIIEGHVPTELQTNRVVALDISLLLIGTRFRGDFEERLKQILQEITASPGIITVIDELHLLMQSGVAEGSLNAPNLFKPMLARGEFQCIGATTLEEYRKTIEADAALERRFQPIIVSEASTTEALEVLRGLRSRYEDFHHVTLSDETLLAAVQMSARYVLQRYQPDKALDLLDEAAARVAVQRSAVPEQVLHLREALAGIRREKNCVIDQRDFPQAAQLLKQERQLHKNLWEAENTWQMNRQNRLPVTQQHIAEVVAQWTGIPVTEITSDESQRLLNLEKELERCVIGQEEAIKVVASAVRRARVNIRDRRRPIGSFVFVGPTGVGKTELARSLAAALTGDEYALLKLDMSEFMESHMVSRLIGSPPGYVGYERGGQLTEVVRRRPYSVVLFDEIEKAHPSVSDLLLQILEDGRLTDAQGHPVDFTNTIIIMTSNAGTAQFLKGKMAFTNKRLGEQESSIALHRDIRNQALSALKKLFKPELLNRVDEIVLFRVLEQEHLHMIVDLMIEQIRSRLSARALKLQVTIAARSLLVEHSYDPMYGARPLRRTIQQMLEDRLAEVILHGTVSGGMTIVVDEADGQLTIRGVQTNADSPTDDTQEAA
jgi:ATP-dependent Clp protease ATP-binding subunit ClpC